MLTSITLRGWHNDRFCEWTLKYTKIKVSWRCWNSICVLQLDFWFTNFHPHKANMLVESTYARQTARWCSYTACGIEYDCHFSDFGPVVFRRVHKIAKRLLIVCLSLHQYGTTHFTGRTLYLSIFQKSVEKIQFSLKPDKKNGYFTWTPIRIYNSISPNS